jgi:hypothetical protein
MIYEPFGEELDDLSCLCSPGRRHAMYGPAQRIWYTCALDPISAVDRLIDTMLALNQWFDRMITDEGAARSLVEHVTVIPVPEKIIFSVYSHGSLLFVKGKSAAPPVIVERERKRRKRRQSKV